MNPKRRVVVHFRSEDLSLRDLEREHRTRGYVRCGFHFVVRKTGLVEAGRPINSAGLSGDSLDPHVVSVVVTGEVNARTDKAVAEIAETHGKLPITFL